MTSDMENITYSYIPGSWSHEAYVRSGGFVVVFLNYNKGALVEGAAKSALSQDWPMLEIFMMDDASTDGSGDIMERVAREYRGHHKVTVVRNLKNRSITGQWNLVSKLATGWWFGMFCGDDISFPDRVSKIAAILKEYPSALGICTNAVVKGEDRTFCKNNHKRGVWCGENGPLPPENFFGGMAFWHRCLFSDPLPWGNIDDILLQYRAMVLGARRDSVSLVWALDINTVVYSLCGITNGEVRKTWDEKKKCRRLWQQGRIRREYAKKNGIILWRGVMDYADKHLSGGRLRCQLNGHAVLRSMEAASWIGRLRIFLRVFVLRNQDFDLMTQRVRKQTAALFLMYLFGLVSYVAYFLAIDFRCKWRNSRHVKS